MPFGLANVPVIFQTYVNKTLTNIVDIFCVIYFDDILIFFNNCDKYVEHVRDVLRRLRKFELYANSKKCEFFVKEIEYLKFIVSTEDIAMNLQRIEIIKNWPMLKSFRDIQVFLRFINFYRWFIYRYSVIIFPLTNLLKNMKIDVKKIFLIPTSLLRQFSIFFAKFFKKRLY